MSYLSTGSENPLPRKSIADHASLSYISIVKEQTTENRLGRSLWLTTARGSPAKPGLSLDFEETQTGRAIRPAVRLAYIFSPNCPVNTLDEESLQFIPGVEPGTEFASKNRPADRVLLPVRCSPDKNKEILDSLSQSSHNKTPYRD